MFLVLLCQILQSRVQGSLQIRKLNM